MLLATGESGFRVYDAGGGEDDAVSGLIGEADKDRAQSHDKDRAQSIGRDRAQSIDKDRAQSNDRDRAQSNVGQTLRGKTPESEVDVESGLEAEWLEAERLGSGFEIGTGEGIGLDVFGRLANTSTTHIHRSPPSKQAKGMTTQLQDTKLASRSNNNHRRTQLNSSQNNQPQYQTKGRNEDSEDDDYNTNETNDDSGDIHWVGGKQQIMNENESNHGVSYLAREDRAFVRWTHQHTLLTPTERHVVIAASFKV